MNEFELIRRYFGQHAPRGDWCRLGIGDDAAVIVPPADRELVLCSDTLVAGRHFPERTGARDIGWKSLAVNLSDLAAMGAEPMGCLLNLTLPRVDVDWLEEFAAGLFSLAVQHDVELVGGDTTGGPLSVSLTAFGSVPPGRALRRSGAQVDDAVAVIGKLGGAALALRQGQSASAALQDCLNRPTPLVQAGMQLRGKAHAAIDVSDGLAADLGHMLEASAVGAELMLDQLPWHPELSALAPDDAQALALHGGDDYALCVALPEAECKQLAAGGFGLRRIGRIVDTPGLRGVDGNGVVRELPRQGYRHFE